MITKPDGLVSTGELCLTVCGSTWRSTHRAPLYVNVLRHGRTLIAMPVDQGGGIRDGDTQRVHLSVGDGGMLCWEPPAATLWLPGPGEPGQDGACLVEIDVEAGSRAVFAGRPNIPFAGSHARQETHIRLEPGAGIVYTEVHTLGRLGRGEWSQFSSYGSRLTLEMGGRDVFLEDWSLQGGEVPSGPSGLLGCGTWATGLAVGESEIGRLRIWKQELADRGAIVETDMIDPSICLLRALDPSGVAFSSGAFSGSRPGRSDRQGLECPAIEVTP